MQSTSYHIPPTFEAHDEKSRHDAVVEVSPPHTVNAQADKSWSARLFPLRQKLHLYWGLEVGASIVSLCLFVAIIVVLKVNDGVELSTRGKGAKAKPTIFPVLSFLSTVMRSAMLLPVATAIGQLKWSWFRRGRHLKDMERFDDASRGLLGSIKFILSMRFRNIAVVGAVLTLLALPLDPLIQSSVFIPTALLPNEFTFETSPDHFITNETTLGRTTTYTTWQTMDDASKPWPDTPMLNAVNMGLMYSNGLSDIVKAAVHVDCPTGYCQFPTAQTLTIGSICVDRTKDLQNVSETKTTAAYKTLAGTDLEFYYDGARNFSRQVLTARSYWEDPGSNYTKNTFGHDVPLIARTAVILDYLGNLTIAFECALHWGVETSAAYVNDTSGFDYAPDDKSDVKWHYEALGDSSDFLWRLEPEKCIVDDEEISKDQSDNYLDQCVFTVSRNAGVALQNFLLDKTDGFTGDSYYIGLDSNGNTKWTRTNNFVTNLWQTASQVKSAAMALDDYGSVWSNIALLMRFTVRQSETVLSNGTSIHLTSAGLVQSPVSFYSISWPRLAAPAFIVLCCLLFTLYTAIVTRKEYGWRKSALPLLFHGIADDEKTALGDVRDLLTMQKLSDEMRVKLVEHVDINGARFTSRYT